MFDTSIITNLKVAEIVVAFKHSLNRLILLDYDGTLVPIQDNPYEVKPNNKLLNIIESLSSNPRNTIAIITGRDKEYISNWFGKMNLYLFAEHGSYSKDPKQTFWTSTSEENKKWKSAVLPIFKSLCDKIEGAFIEEKDYSISWHYRKANPELSYGFIEELLKIIKSKIPREIDINILNGKRVIEVEQNGSDKGDASKKMITLKPFHTIISIGDDISDEEMFQVLPHHAYTFKVGYGKTKAKMRIENSSEVLEFLQKLI